MNARKKLKLLIIFSIIIFLVGVICFYSNNLHICGDYGCSLDITLGYGKPIINFFLTIIVIAILMFFLNEKIINFWIKVISIVTPILLLVLYISPASCQGGFFPCFNDREAMSIYASIFFIATTLLTVAIKAIALSVKRHREGAV